MADDADVVAIPPPTAIREAYRRAEALVRGLGRVQLATGIYAVAVAVVAIVDTVGTYRRVAASGGRLTAPWIFDPIRIAMLVLLLSYGLTASVVGYGLRRLRLWAGSGIWACIALGTLLVLAFWLRLAGTGSHHELAGCLLGSFFAVPPIVLVWSIGDPATRDVLSAEYADVVGRTREIKVKPSLSWSMRLALLLLFLASVGLAVAVDVLGGAA